VGLVFQWGVAVASGKSNAKAPQSAAKSVGARSSPPVSSPETLRPVGADFCVSGGAPVVGDPIIDHASALHFVSADSYLHSFESDGRFRSSYTLDAAPSSGVVERDDGVLLALTVRGGLYGLEGSGQLRFQRKLGVLPASGLISLGQGRSGFLAQSGEFVVLGAWGEIIYRVRVRGPISGEAVLVGGQVWLARGTELLALEAAWRQHVVPLPAPIRRLFAAKKGELAHALVGKILYQIHHNSGTPGAIEVVSENVLEATAGEGTVAYVRSGGAGGYELVASRKSADSAESTQALRLSKVVPSGAPLLLGTRAFFPFVDEVWEVGSSPAEPRVFHTDPGSPLLGRGELLMSVHHGHLVCIQRLSRAGSGVP